MIKINFKNVKKDSGFTLIELLVVIAIIGLLSSIVLASLSTAKDKATNANALAEIHQVQIAMEYYYEANGSYPNPNQSGIGTYCIGGTTCKDSLGNAVADYFSFNINSESNLAQSNSVISDIVSFFRPETANAAAYASPTQLSGFKKLSTPITYYCSYYLVNPYQSYCPTGYVWLTYPQKSGNTTTYVTVSGSAVSASTY